ncbi:probable methyltransferase-like protein 24 [Dreissena polymorpha]|nr:probable methyltransferase-like protein 24 [Dreissena polymorpha]
MDLKSTMHSRRVGPYVLFLFGFSGFCAIVSYKVIFSGRGSKKGSNPDLICQPEDLLDTLFIQEVKTNLTLRVPSADFLLSRSREELAVLYHRYIELPQLRCDRKLRLGNQDDGGWDLCDDRNFRPEKPCIAYSFGINNDFSFDDAVSSEYGCTVHSFDPSMDLRDTQRGHLSYFHARGISHMDQMVKVGDTDWELLKYNTIRRRLGHESETVSILKIDVEGYEWAVLKDIMEDSNLIGTKNLAVEFHLELSGKEQGKSRYLQALDVLRQLYESGFRIFWSHQNHYCRLVSKCRKEVRTNCHDVSFVKIS